MKKKILSLLCVGTIALTAVSSLTACGNDNPPQKDNGNAKTISQTLLDGKIANFLGAEGIGVLDKNTVTANSGNNPFNVTFNSAQPPEVQKKNELVKETENGTMDVHFYQKENDRKGYKDLNAKYETHHHESVECTEVDCDRLSDEIVAEENTGAGQTVISLDARVNKLYNAGAFTFMSVSSAVEGNIQVLTFMSRDTRGKVALGNKEVVLNWGNVAEAATKGVTFINVSSGDKKGVILVKKYAEDAYFHSTNYWCDDFNQSYIIDNKTGVTYSLNQFPEIYSVEGGLIRVYNENSNGKFDYYTPSVSNGNLTLNKINLPTREQFAIGDYTNGVVKQDIYGNIVVISNELSQDSAINEYGEKKFGDKIILTTKNQQVYDQILSHGANDRQMAELYANRYRSANRYHSGSDGRIYRVDFRGSLSEISVMVLDANCTWQQVENNVEVDFDLAEGFIGVYFGVRRDQLDEFLITKIKNGYAYYSAAGHSDGYNIWGGVTVNGNDIERHGEYSGVVKIPTTGAVKDGNDRYEHLTTVYEMIKRYGVDFNDPYATFLVGETQMIFLYGDNTKKLVLVDVETGESKTLENTRLKGFERECVLFENYGWLPLFKTFDVENFGTSDFNSQVVYRANELDVYYEMLLAKRQ